VKRVTTLAIGDRDEALQYGAFSLKPTALVVKGKPSFDEWTECGVWLQHIAGALQFWIGDWLNFGERAYGEKYAQAVDESQADVWRVYASVADNVPLLMRINNLSWTHHYQVAKFSKTPDLQRELLARAVGLSVSDFKALIRTRVHGDKVAAIAAGTLTAAEYDVVCADPPWQYDNSGFDQSAAAHYPTMDVQAISDLPEADPTFPKFADPCVLFLWATSPLLPAATTVMAAWGFDYKACLVWVKDKAPGLGWWLNTRHELLLVGSRGSTTPLEKVDSVINAAAADHSRKPIEAYAAIDRMYPPGLRRVELFARAPRLGWDVWGQEV
jgi:N6-adenosine-specific RNA methylase IME4